MYFYVKINYMPQAKTELFETDLQTTSLFLKALSHPARLMILKFLADCKSCYTGDISSELPLSRSTVNQHLAELSKAGLIRGHIAGNKTNYCIDTDRIAEMKSLVTGFMDELDITIPFECK